MSVLDWGRSKGLHTTCMAHVFFEVISTRSCLKTLRKHRFHIYSNGSRCWKLSGLPCCFVVDNFLNWYIYIYIYRVGGIQSRQPHLSRSARRTSKTSINEWNSLSVASLFHSTCLAYSTAVPEVVDEATSTLQLYLTRLPCPLSLYRIHSTQLMIACSRTTLSLCNKLNCLQFPLVVIVIRYSFVYCLKIAHLEDFRAPNPRRIWERFLRLPNDLAAFDKREGSLLTPSLFLSHCYHGAGY